MINLEDNLNHITEELSVIMPSYNEEDLIETAVKEVQDCVLNQVSGASLFIMDGGSTDGTVKIIERLMQEDNRIKLVYKPGCKHGPSLILGMNMAKSKYIFLIDSDMQIPLNCFSKLWNMKDTYDAILGTRHNRQDPKQRLLVSLIAKTLIKIIFSVDLIDANAPCKLFKLSIWQDMRSRLNVEDLLVPSMFIAIFAKSQKYKVIEIPVIHKAREAGQNISLQTILRTGLKVCTEFFKYRTNLLRPPISS